MVDGGCADDHLRRITQLRKPILLQAAPEVANAIRERPESIPGKIQEGLRSVHEDGSSLPKMGQQTDYQPSRSGSGINQEKLVA